MIGEPTYDAASLRTVQALAAAFGLDPGTLGSSPVLPRVLPTLLAQLSPEDVVASIRDQGGLRSAQDPYAALVARLRQLAGLLGRRSIVPGGNSSDRDARALAEARHRAVLRGLVATGTLTDEDVEEVVAGYRRSSAARGTYRSVRNRLGHPPIGERR